MKPVLLELWHLSATSRRRGDRASRPRQAVVQDRRAGPRPSRPSEGGIVISDRALAVILAAVAAPGVSPYAARVGPGPGWRRHRAVVLGLAVQTEGPRHDAPTHPHTMAISAFGERRHLQRCKGMKSDLTQNQVVATSCWFESDQGHQSSQVHTAAFRDRQALTPAV